MSQDKDWPALLLQDHKGFYLPVPACLTACKISVIVVHLNFFLTCEASMQLHKNVKILLLVFSILLYSVHYNKQIIWSIAQYFGWSALKRNAFGKMLIYFLLPCWLLLSFIWPLFMLKPSRLFYQNFRDLWWELSKEQRHLCNKKEKGWYGRCRLGKEEQKKNEK